MAKLLLVCLLLSSFALLASSLPLKFERIKVWGGTQDIFVALGVSVGNPHTITYNLTLDFDNGQSVLLGVNSTRLQCIVSKRNYFDLGRSTTFRRIKQDRFETAPYMYGRYCYAFQPSDGAAAVTFGRDDFQFVDGVFHGVPFGVLTAFNGSWSPDWPSDGVLGFSNHPAYRNLSAARTLAILGGGQNCGPELQSQYLCNSATISLNGGRTPGMHAGDITFGQIPDYCGTVQEADPAGPNQSWSFNVQSAQFGALSDQDHGGKAYLQWSSSDLVEMPQALLDAMMRQVGARKNATTGTYYVDCGRTEELPPFKLYLYGAKVLELKFSPAQYVQQIPKAKQCPVLLRGTTGPIWTFGNRLAEAYCVLMNFTNQKLGFAAK